MSPSKIKDELRIFTPIGQLGQGWSEQIFWDALESGIDGIIIDGGSTDSGPGRLAQGRTNVPKAGLERDLRNLAKACQVYNVPVLIGSAGGDGENAMVDMCANIIAEAVRDNGYRPMKVISIYSEIPKDHIRQKLKDGLISPCGGAVPELTEHDIATSTRVVAQMGLEPFLQAMRDNPGFDVIVGGRAYDPAPYAAFCLYHGFEDMGVNYAMGKIMECGAQCSIPKSREAIAVVRRDSFDMIPLDPKSRCTTVSVASHFLYEKTRPDVLHGPGGALHLGGTTYEQLDDRSVRVRGAKFQPEPEGEYTVKLEGARNSGYHTIFVGALRDPILLSQLDPWVTTIEASVKEKMAHIKFDLKIHKYGHDGVMGPLEYDRTTVPKEVCICGQVRAPTQDEANQVASMTKFHFTHLPYPGQLATAGNFAWPFTPCEIPMGPLPEFCVYHIMHKSDPLTLFPIKVDDVHGPPKVEQSKAAAKTTAVKSEGSPQKYYLKPEPAEGTCYLADVASVLRSKNSGPYELTLDVMFPDHEIYEKVKKAGILERETVSKLYKVAENDVLASLFFDQAMAYKATIKRPSVSGGFAETDTHGSQQHIPLMYLTLPWGRDPDVEVLCVESVKDKDTTPPLETAYVYRKPARPPPKTGLEKRLVWKMDLLPVPQMALMYFITFLDRNSFGNGRIMGLQRDLHMMNQDYSSAAQLFFVGYLLFMLPGNIFLRWISPYFVFGCGIISFGAFLCGMSGAQSYGTVLAMRIMIRVAQAFVQGIGMYSALWYTRTEVATRGALYFSAATLSGAFSGLISYRIAQNLTEEKTGWEPWRWLLLIEGLMGVFIGILIIVLLPAFPDQMKKGKNWLFSKEEIQLAIQRSSGKSFALWSIYPDAFCKANLSTGASQRGIPGIPNFVGLKSALMDPKAWSFALIQGGASLPVTSIGIFLPSFIRGFGFSDIDAQLFSVIPYACAFVVLPTMCMISDQINRKAPFIILGFIAAAVEHLILLFVESTAVKIVGTCFICAGVYSSVVLDVTWLAINNGGFTKRGTTWALAEMVGQAFAIMGANVYDDRPRYVKGHSIALAFLLLAIVLVMVNWAWMRHGNKKRDRILAEYGERNEVHPDTNKSLEERFDYHINSRYTL
ncbi:uncharacterized protein Z518_09782 [Rhinocladiella mackenziei CBS 650.93]|uniref:Major facilitator superfamily (MFS) profile domain-containing protein n=1 Tax=Rhinocladiella mackenziei CBS 650.93 TaxID=1442369 RepID=A0A0D2FFC6_9EURO|nr:uncharacterized protein Z518_09782 [Rhinocladiella mackenziei CBS 650.93]KIX00717.1 hypothetical protein Z518_09782 [Rhinocladiella mackenziei CBS 650.93]